MAAKRERIFRTFRLVLKRNASLLSHLKETRVLHKPVMVKECLEFLSPRKGKIFVDATFGAGGHTCSLLNAADCKVYAVDRDPLAFEIASVLSKRQEYKDRLIPCQAKFSSLYKCLKLKEVEDNSVDGILLDLGASSMQFDDADRGFSVTKNGPLDMRMDGSNSKGSFTAAMAVNLLSENELATIFKQYSQEKDAALIAKSIVRSRRLHPIETTQHLAAIVASCVGYGRRDKLNRHAHPATKTFLALRVLVNDEFYEERAALKAAAKLLQPGGRLVVISFNWMEDAIVKSFLQGKDIDKRILQTRNRAGRTRLRNSNPETSEGWNSLHRTKVVEPSLEEVKGNHRSRSARLRAVQKAEAEVLCLGPETNH